MSLIPAASGSTYANQAATSARYDRYACTGERKCKCPKCHPTCSVWCSHPGRTPR